MYDFFLEAVDRLATDAVCDIYFVHEKNFDINLLTDFEKNWLESAYNLETASVYLLPDHSGHISKVILKHDDHNLMLCIAACLKILPGSQCYCLKM